MQRSKEAKRTFDRFDGPAIETQERVKDGDCQPPI